MVDDVLRHWEYVASERQNVVLQSMMRRLEILRRQENAVFRAKLRYKQEQDAIALAEAEATQLA